MRITIVGAGKVGLSLAKQLQREDCSITVIDRSEPVIDRIGNTLDVMGYVGNGASYSVLKQAGVENSDLLIAVTTTDEVNLLCCLTARRLGVRHTVARVRNPEYGDQLWFLKDDLGLSMAINPELAAAEEITRLLSFPSAARVELFARGRVELVSCRVAAGSMLDGLKLNELPQRLGVKVLICAVDRSGDVSTPDGSFVLRGGDDIYFTGSPKEIERTFRKAKMLINPVHSVMITGGGRITYYLAEKLCKRGMDVKIIEMNDERARELAELLPQAAVLHGDAADHELLGEEGLEKTDAFVSLTGIDEGNILSSIYAKRHNVAKVITKVNNDNLAELVKNSGLESFISPKRLTINQILRYVRALAAGKPVGNVLSLYKLAGGRVEVSEFLAENDPALVNIPLKDLKLKNKTLIACLVRREQAIIPGGENCIHAGDGVLVITSDRRLTQLSDILEA